MAALKLPGGALLFNTTHFFLPTWCQDIISASLIDQQEIEVSLYVHGYNPPSLFIAVNCLKGHPKDFSQLNLGLAKLFS
jgi:hypothetical protein